MKITRLNMKMTLCSNTSRLCCYLYKSISLFSLHISFLNKSNRSNHIMILFFYYSSSYFLVGGRKLIEGKIWQWWEISKSSEHEPQCVSFVRRIFFHYHTDSYPHTINWEIKKLYNPLSHPIFALYYWIFWFI